MLFLVPHWLCAVKPFKLLGDFSERMQIQYAIASQALAISRGPLCKVRCAHSGPQTYKHSICARKLLSVHQCFFCTTYCAQSSPSCFKAIFRRRQITRISERKRVSRVSDLDTLAFQHKIEKIPQKIPDGSQKASHIVISENMWKKRQNHEATLMLSNGLLTFLMAFLLIYFLIKESL